MIMTFNILYIMILVTSLSIHGINTNTNHYTIIVTSVTLRTPQQVNTTIHVVAHHAYIYTVV